MHRVVGPLLLLLLLPAPGVLAQEVPTAADATDRGRSLARILDVLLTPAGEEEETLVLLLDPTESLRTAGFAEELGEALDRNSARLEAARIGVARVGGSGRPALLPATDRDGVVAAAREIVESPEGAVQNVYAAVRELAAALAGGEGSRRLILVTLENGDAEDDVEATLAALRRSGVTLAVVAREAFLSDTWWVSRNTRPPRGMEFHGGEAAFVEVPWGWLFQQSVANQVVPSGFAMYGLSRIATGSGGRLFLYYPPSAGGHQCAVYGSCPFCSGDHLPRGESYQAHRLRALAPLATSRPEALVAAAKDPWFRATLRAWERASREGLVRSRPSVKRSGSTFRLERRATGGTVPLGQSTSFSSQASRAEKLVVGCEEILRDLLAEMDSIDESEGLPRYRAVAELTAVMLRITRLNLLGFIAFCREVGPELVRTGPDGPEPPERPWFAPDQQFTGIGYTNLSLCHGVKPFLELHLPGGEAFRGELRELAPVVEGFLSRYSHTPFASAVRRSGIARFTPTVRGKYVKPPDRDIPTGPTDDTATDRPTRAGGGGSGGGGTATGGD